jgi:hypothetical protein
MWLKLVFFFFFGDNPSVLIISEYSPRGLHDSIRNTPYKLCTEKNRMRIYLVRLNIAGLDASNWFMRPIRLLSVSHDPYRVGRIWFHTNQSTILDTLTTCLETR